MRTRHRAEPHNLRTLTAEAESPTQRAESAGSRALEEADTLSYMSVCGTACRHVAR